MSYDGRETDLNALTTLPLVGPAVGSPRVRVAADAAYLEMAHPDDVTRRISDGGRTPDLSQTTRYGLFGYDLEKGVVVRGRLRGAWVPAQEAKTESVRRMEELLKEPLPLGP